MEKILIIGRGSNAKGTIQYHRHDLFGVLGAGRAHGGENGRNGGCLRQSPHKYDESRLRRECHEPRRHHRGGGGGGLRCERQGRIRCAEGAGRRPRRCAGRKRGGRCGGQGHPGDAHASPHLHPLSRADRRRLDEPYIRGVGHPLRARLYGYLLGRGECADLCARTISAHSADHVCQPYILRQWFSQSPARGAEHGQPRRHRLDGVRSLWRICDAAHELRSGARRPRPHRGVRYESLL